MQIFSSEWNSVRSVGGRDGEKQEREKWVNRERKRIEDSVNGNSLIQFICRLAMLMFFASICQSV